MSDILKIDIEKIDYNLFRDVQEKLDSLAMPLGSLGSLHELAKRIVGITRDLNPTLENFTILIFAGDHGITQQGVSAYTYKITYYNVLNMLSGRSTINAFAKSVGAKIAIVDIGINSEKIKMDTSSPDILFLDLRVGNGTKDCSITSSMSIEEVIKGIENGYNATESIINKNDLIGIGEMGIGNSSIASLLISHLLNVPIDETTGPGAGLNDIGVSKKKKVLEKALLRIKYISKKDIIKVLSEIGGHEINGMIGSILCAAKYKKPILIDGVISSAAALSAYFINENIRDYLIFCTQSTEPGHNFISSYFSQEPILSLGLRLGEGTGVALAYPLVKASITQLNEIADLKDITIDKPNFEGFFSRW